MPTADQPTPTHAELAGFVTEVAMRMRPPDGQRLWNLTASYIAASVAKDARIAELEREVAELKRRHEPTEEIL